MGDGVIGVGGVMEAVLRVVALTVVAEVVALSTMLSGLTDWESLDLIPSSGISKRFGLAGVEAGAGVCGAKEPLKEEEGRRTGETP